MTVQTKHLNINSNIVHSEYAPEPKFYEQYLGGSDSKEMQLFLQDLLQSPEINAVKEETLNNFTKAGHCVAKQVPPCQGMGQFAFSKPSGRLYFNQNGYGAIAYYATVLTYEWTLFESWNSAVVIPVRTVIITEEVHPDFTPYKPGLTPGEYKDSLTKTFEIYDIEDLSPKLKILRDR